MASFLNGLFGSADTTIGTLSRLSQNVGSTLSVLSSEGETSSALGNALSLAATLPTRINTTSTQSLMDGLDTAKHSLDSAIRYATLGQAITGSDVITDLIGASTTIAITAGIPQAVDLSRWSQVQDAGPLDRNVDDFLDTRISVQDALLHELVAEGDSEITQFTEFITSRPEVIPLMDFHNNAMKILTRSPNRAEMYIDADHKRHFKVYIEFNFLQGAKLFQVPANCIISGRCAPWREWNSELIQPASTGGSMTLTIQDSVTNVIKIAFPAGVRSFSYELQNPSGNPYTFVMAAGTHGVCVWDFFISEAVVTPPIKKPMEGMILSDDLPHFKVRVALSEWLTGNLNTVVTLASAAFPSAPRQSLKNFDSFYFGTQSLATGIPAGWNAWWSVRDNRHMLWQQIVPLIISNPSVALGKVL